MSRARRSSRAPSAVAAALLGLAAAACSEAGAGTGADTRTSTESPRAARPVVAETPPAAATDLQRLLADAGSAKTTVRGPALAALAAGGADARRASEAAIASDDVQRRRGGARALESLADAESAGALAAALARPSPMEEDALVRALARAASPAAGVALVAAVVGDDPRRALLAGAALADFTGPLDLRPLRDAARADRAFHVRQAALLALGGHAAPEDRPVFDAASRDAAEPIRAASVRGIFTLPPVDVKDLRRLMLDDPAAMVRQAAAAEALHVVSGDVVPVLLRAAGEFDGDVASEAVETLAKRTEPAAFDALLEVVRDDSRTPHLRGTAARRALALDRDRTMAMLKSESAIFDLETRAYCDEILFARAGR